jgi:hypothetical protein
LTQFYIFSLLVFLCWLLVCLVGHGYANTVDQLSWWLHKHAVHVRGLHGRRAAVVQERWVRELERADG